MVVAEAGASPLEPYNGSIAKDVIRDHVKFKLLCAQDPYAVVGVQQAFQRAPDLVAGGAANTDAAIALVKKLTGLPAMDLMHPACLDQLEGMLRRALDLKSGNAGRTRHGLVSNSQVLCFASVEMSLSMPTPDWDLPHYLRFLMNSRANLSLALLSNGVYPSLSCLNIKGL